jgi:hypothetical protein
MLQYKFAATAAQSQSRLSGISLNEAETRKIKWAMPEAGTWAWIACIEGQCRWARVTGELHSGCNVNRFPEFNGKAAPRIREKRAFACACVPRMSVH